MVVKGVDVGAENEIRQLLHRFHRVNVGIVGQLVVDVALGQVGKGRVVLRQFLGKGLQGIVERNLEAAGEQGQQGRITSYNVCYTKLLRLFARITYIFDPLQTIYEHEKVHRKISVLLVFLFLVV